MRSDEERGHDEGDTSNRGAEGTEPGIDEAAGSEATTPGPAEDATMTEPRSARDDAAMPEPARDAAMTETASHASTLVPRSGGAATPASSAAGSGGDTRGSRAQRVAAKRKRAQSPAERADG